MKKRRSCALLLAAVCALSLAVPCAAACYEAFDRPDTAFADMVYTGVDTAAVDAFCERFARDPAGEYDALLALYDEVYTQNELAYIAMCEHAGDEARSAESERAANDFAYASDRLCLAISEALDGEHGGALRARMPDGEADAFSGYEAADDGTLDGYSTENALVQEYYRLPDDDAFADAAADVYLRLAALRREQAADAGWDSCADYAYASQYAREYDPADARALHRAVKSRLAPLYVRCERILARRETPWDDEDVPSGAEILDALQAHMGSVSPELTEALDYLRRNGLFRVGGDDALYDTGFTVSLPAYRAVFLFNKVSTRFDAFSSTAHEFGHFNAAYHDPTPVLYQYPNADVSELQAQGLELLFLPALQEILAGGDANARDYVALYALTRMLSSVIDGCLYDEFEQTVYASPGLTADELFALERRLYRAYGLDAVYDEEPFWGYIPHRFDQPFYYISYAASALPALDLWLRSREDYAAAVDAYLAVSAARTDAWFLDVLREGGLCDVTDAQAVARLARALERETGALLGRRCDGYGWALGGAAVVVAGCCAVLWVRKRLPRRGSCHAKRD
ncbi:MAG: hypothetical protein IJT71_04930 [Oscillospiraceae bacterium]|nr:hypothetical protein [Oscillospiraceae bacterium]